MAVNRQLPVYQELVRALKAEAKAIKAVRQTQHFIYEMLDVSTLRILHRHKSVLNTVEVRCKNAEASRTYLYGRDFLRIYT